MGLIAKLWQWLVRVTEDPPYDPTDTEDSLEGPGSWPFDQ